MVITSNDQISFMLKVLLVYCFICFYIHAKFIVSLPDFIAYTLFDERKAPSLLVIEVFIIGF